MSDKIAHLKANIDTPPIAADLILEPYRIGKFTFSGIGLEIASKPTYEEWEHVGQMLAVQMRGLQFIVGDWLRLGEDHFGEMAAQAIDASKWSEETVRNYIWVAKNVPMANRRQDLTFAHHQVVAGMKSGDQKRWLKRAATDNPERVWSVSELKAAIKESGEVVGKTTLYLLVEVKNETARETLTKDLEQRGYTCKPIERRGGRRQGD